MSPKNERQITKQDWDSLSEQDRKDLFYMACFGLWRQDRRDVPATRLQLLRGAWVLYTSPIERAWHKLNLQPEERAMLGAGVLIGFLYVLALISKVG